MTRFVLSLLPDDRAVLTTEEPLSYEDTVRLRDAYDGWLQKGGLAVIAECRVQRIVSIDLVLDRDELVPA